jgi:proton-dependent oligopeptide transporter, POT family
MLLPVWAKAQISGEWFMADVATQGSGEWFGHPKPLARLFSSELWERFGYYGMRAILVLYLSNHFLFPDAVAGGMYGAFTSLVYLTPLFGGLIADRVLGSKRSVKFGAILMSIGYFILCFGGEQAKPFMEYQGTKYTVESVANGETKTQYVIAGDQKLAVKGNEDGTLSLTGSDGSVLPATLAKGSYKFDGERNPKWVSLMLLALTCVIVGNGFFKPNISTMVGSLYSEGDNRRDAGFTIFYMGINLGSIISQFLVPLFAIWFGWWSGFLLVAVGMMIAFLLFQFDGGRLHGYGDPPKGATANPLLVYGGALLCIPLVWFLLNNTMVNAAAAAEAAKSGTGILAYFMSLPVLGQALTLTFIAAMIGFPTYAFMNGSTVEAQKMLSAIILMFFSVVFWTIFEQAGSSMTYFAERSTDRNIFGYLMPAGQVQIFNPLFIVALAPLFSVMWIWLGKRGWEPGIPVKFAIALILAGAGFLALVAGGGVADSNYKVALIWLVLAYLLHSIGELCLSPVGLSMVTKLSMPSVVGMMMGTWFLSISMAQYVGGAITQSAAVETVGGEVTNPKLALETYVDVFQRIGWWSVGIGVLLFVGSPLMKRMMHGVK